MALSALEGMLEQTKSDIVPMLWNHDPRIPPIGRLLSGRIDKLPDGEFAFVGTSDLFEPDDEIPLIDDGREIPIRIPEAPVEVIFDRSYMSTEDQEDIDFIARTTGGGKQEAGKKALEPLSILAIVGIYLLGRFAEGLLQKVGEDA